MDGFTTRAIRAASRAPRADQRPTSVPIIPPGLPPVSAGPDDAADLGTDLDRALAAARAAR